MTGDPAAARRRRAWARRCTAAVLAVAATGAVLAEAATPGRAPSSSLPLKPLSSLGRLKAAPSPGPVGLEGVPIPQAPVLAEPTAASTTRVVDGIKCQTREQALFHIHSHLAIFVQGKPRQVPFGIGIGPPLYGQRNAAGPFVTSGSCFSWLHTHAPDGIIHVESPVHRTYTLGEFFDVWGQPLSPTRVGPAPGKVTALFNGKVFTGNPRTIPLLKHARIQLEVGTPLVAPVKASFPNGL